VADLVWIDGTLVAPAAATVSAFDHGLTVGDGVFETLQAIDGTPFAMRRHLERLRNSTGLVGLDLPWSDDDLRAAVAGVLASGPRPRARVRITVTGGAGALGPRRGDGAPTVLVMAGPLAAAEPSVAVCTVPWPRNERGVLAGVKSTSFGEGVVALEHARARGCGEALFADTQGRLCEGTASNVFVAVDGRLRTPSLSSGCLPGVTRELLLEIVDAVEEELPIAVLASADEVLLTSTGRGVQPVHDVDGRPLPAPGPCTTEAMAAFAALVARDLDP
jgi:branched-chain amino acid aminotransferase